MINLKWAVTQHTGWTYRHEPDPDEQELMRIQETQELVDQNYPEPWEFLLDHLQAEKGLQLKEYKA